MTDKLPRAFQVAVLLLLAAILAVQVSILTLLSPKLPTIGDFQRTQGEERRRVVERIPCIRVMSGSVEVSGPVDVHVENTPLEVEIVNN